MVTESDNEDYNAPQFGLLREAEYEARLDALGPPQNPNSIDLVLRVR